MTDQTPPSGKPYRPGLDEIDAWSEALFAALSPWAQPLGGTWEVWDPGYLVLEVTSDGDAAVDRVVLWTAEEELTVAFGHWETHLPYHEAGEDDLERKAAAEAIELVNEWLHGGTATSVYWNADGEWCGSKIHNKAEAAAFVGDTEFTAWLRPTRIELRTARREGWRQFSIKDGVVTEIGI